MEDDMNVKSLIPWGRSHAPVPYRNEDATPLLALHREVNRLFDDLWRGFDTPLASIGAFAPWPSLDVAETEDAFRVTAELPGLEEKDVEVMLNDDVLTISGEKKLESSGKESVSRSERFHGQFERRLDLGALIDRDKVTAAFSNGVLTITLPKAEEAKARVKRIAINGKQ